MQEKEYNILGIRKRAILLRSKTIHGIELTIMEAITEEQEKRIDKSSDYFGSIQYRCKHGVIPQKDIYLYGQVDLTNQDDIQMIKKCNLIDNDNLDNFIYKSFDYKTGIIKTEDDVTKITVCTSPLEWFKYNYCLIGKPERIIVYKLLKFNLND